MTVRDFISQYYVNPTSRVKLKDAYQSFLASLPESRRSVWPRWRFAEAVAELLPVGKDSEGVVYIGGISTTPPKAWVVDSDGRLRLKNTA